MKTLAQNLDINTVAKIITVGFIATCSAWIIVTAITTGKGL